MFRFSLSDCTLIISSSPIASYELPLEFPQPIESYALGVNVEVSASEVGGVPKLRSDLTLLDEGTLFHLNRMA
jgi:hypothetical protein